MKAAMSKKLFTVRTSFARATCASALAISLAACGGGSGGSIDNGSGVTPPVPTPVPEAARYTLGGTVSGMTSGATVVLANGAEKVTLAANGAFTFPGKLLADTAFEVRLEQASAGLACSVSNGAAKVGSSDVTAVAVRCLPVVLAGVQEPIQQVAGLVRDASGNIYIADSANQVIHKLTPDGGISRLAGVPGKRGSDDGNAASATFTFVAGSRLAIDRQGNIFVSDFCSALLRKVSPAGVVSTVAGQRRAGCDQYGLELQRPVVDGTGTQASFGTLGTIASDTNGDMLVADTQTNAIRRVSAAGVVSTLQWTFAAMADIPTDYRRIARIAVSPQGDIYFTENNGRYLFRIQNGIATAIAGDHLVPQRFDGIGRRATFVRLRGIDFDQAGNVLLADGSTIRKMQADGTVTTVLVQGSQEADGQYVSARQFNQLMVNADGAVIAYDEGNHVLNKLDQNGKLSVLPQLSGHMGLTDGAGASARLTIGAARAMVTDAAGNVYVADDINKIIRRIAPDGTVSTYAGVAGSQGTFDGPRATANLRGPVALAFDKDGVLYFADQSEQRLSPVLRKIDQQGIVTTVGILPGSSGTRFALAIDKDNNFVWASNASVGIYRRVPGGEFTLFVDFQQVMSVLGGKSVEAGVVPTAKMVFDRQGALFFEDVYNRVIYKVTRAGAVSLFAGIPSQSENKDGAPGTGSLPYSDVFPLAIDAADNLYLGGQGRVRKIDPAGVISTPQLGWGYPAVSALAFANGTLYGYTAQAIVQTPLP